MVKKNEEGFGSIVLLLFGLLCLVGAGILSLRIANRHGFSVESLFINYEHILQELNRPAPERVEFQIKKPQELSVLTTPSPPVQSPNASPERSAKPVPKATNRPSSPPAVPTSPYAEPSSISVTTKRSELYTVLLPKVRIFIPGTRKVGVMPSNGSVGIFGLFLGTDSSHKEVSAYADIEIGITPNLKNGENKVNLLIKPGETAFDALTGSEVLLSIPVSITINE